MSFATIQLEIASGTAMITLSRPDKRNAVSYLLIEELLAALGEVARSPALVLILTGAGRAFCSGMDLENLRSVAGGSVEQSAKDSEAMARFFRSLYDFPKPTIAAVNGAAIAGGCGLATLCDFTLAVAEATFGYTEVRIGFVPAIVSTFLLRQVGEKHARDLLLTGRIISADEAYRIGLINEIVAPERLLGRARELAARLMESSPASQICTKGLLSEYAREELNSRLHAAVLENAAIRASDDFREGVSSFLERRKPRWSGK
jgi:methylglutaconyl-CoA hydratase